MIEERTGPKSGEGFWLWFLKLLSGILVIVLLFVHLTINHFTATGALLNFEEVVAYLSNPLVTFTEVSFLIIVVSHALLGTRSIILDFKPSRGVLRTLDWLFLAVGVISIGYGIWLTRVVISWGTGG
jgi:succinate dehydrogenase / fumarate reductase, membrane anchor subunit